MFHLLTHDFSREAVRKGFGRQKDYNPTQWNEYFAEKKDVLVGNNTFRVYLSAPSEKPGPVLVLLHGGGFSALTWSHFNVINCI